MNWSEESSNSEYGKTKFRAEMEVWRGIGEGLQAVMVNPTIILGAADWEKGSSAIFKMFTTNFMVHRRRNRFCRCTGCCQGNDHAHGK